MPLVAAGLTALLLSACGSGPAGVPAASSATQAGPTAASGEPSLVTPTPAAPTGTAAAATPSESVPATLPATDPGGPTPTARLQGPLASGSSSTVLNGVLRTFLTMRRTVFSHRTVVDETARSYAWDSAGMVDEVLRRSAPGAWHGLHSALGIAPTHAPAVSAWASFVRGKNGPLPASWERVRSITSLRPGDIVLLPATASAGFAGAAVIVGGTPLHLSDGSYAVAVYDSATSPHGPADSRLTDPRAENRSGLGRGTMRFLVDGAGNLRSATWSILTGGPVMSGVPVVAARVRP